MEVASRDHNVDLDTLAKAAKQRQEIEKVKGKSFFVCLNNAYVIYILTVSYKEGLVDINREIRCISPAPVIMQFFLLYRRNLLESKRNWVNQTVPLKSGALFQGFNFSSCTQ